jgi:hypothetical protein
MADLPLITERQRLPSPATTPQALTWHGKELWMGSRDLRRVYRMERDSWTVTEEREAPGIPWAAVWAGNALWFTLGEGPEDDRYLRRFVIGQGFSEERIACPEFTGSYLSHDDEHLYLSQWYKHRILKLDPKGNILREIAIDEEICGHVFVDGLIYVLRGTEQGEGDWRIARLDPQEETPQIKDLARVPFQCRSLALDGEHFWTNHREADQIVSFKIPNGSLQTG